MEYHGKGDGDGGAAFAVADAGDRSRVAGPEDVDASSTKKPLSQGEE